MPEIRQHMHTEREVIDILLQKGENEPRLLVTLDGPCATGKTTLAQFLSESLHAAVLHTDDFVIPHARKTPEQLAIPGGNCDAERLASETLGPWRAGSAATFRRYDFRRDRLCPEEALPNRRILILEGSYCNLPVIRRYADVRLFLTASRETRLRRLRERESPESLQGFFDRWIPLEDAYFEAYRLPDAGCLILRSPD